MADRGGKNSKAVTAEGIREALRDLRETENLSESSKTAEDAAPRYSFLKNPEEAEAKRRRDKAEKYLRNRASELAELAVRALEGCVMNWRTDEPPEGQCALVAVRRARAKNGTAEAVMYDEYSGGGRWRKFAHPDRYVIEAWIPKEEAVGNANDFLKRADASDSEHEAETLKLF